MNKSVVRFYTTVLVGLIAVQALAAQSGFWRNYTSMNNARDAVRMNDLTYVVTSGGVFGFTNNGDIIETLTTSEGLSAVDITSVTVDHQGTLWFGMSGGYLDGYNAESGTWVRVRDITRADFTRRDITSLTPRGDTLYVGTSYGVSIYSVSRNEFNDSYIKFGSFPAQAAVTAVALDNEYIWVGTADGIARGNINDPLLAAPDRWVTFGTMHPVNDILLVGDSPYAATVNGVWRLSGDMFVPVPGFQGMNVRSIVSDGSNIFASAGRSVFHLDETGIISQYGPDTPSGINSLFPAGDNLLCLLEQHGAALLTNNEWNLITPDGPTSNNFIHLDSDPDGTIWVGTGRDGFGRGVYRFNPRSTEGDLWRIFQANIYPQMRSNDYHRVFAASDGTAWLSSWGQGITRVTPDGEVRNFHREDGLIGLAGSPNFIVAGRAAEDIEGNIWFSVFMADEKPLVRLNPETNEITSYRNDHTPRATMLADVTVDRYGTKWVISTSRTELGGVFTLFYFNDDQSVGSNINGWGEVAVRHGLPSNIINAVVEDTRGEIWIATDAGMAAIANPLQPQNSVRDITALRGQYISSIAVDPLNRKWVGTNEGLFLISPDGTSIIETYTSQNTGGQLFSDDIKSVTFDNENGIAYIGTERGLSSIITVAAAPRVSMDVLSVAPNPYRIPAEYSVKIDGLARNSSIKVISADGRLVNSFVSPGGRIAYWDGKDDNGRYVASGVYIIVGYSEDGSEVGKTKVTVIRR